MQTSESVVELAAALAKAQALVKGASKDAINPHFKTRYADLSSVWEACRDAITSNGLSIVQTPLSAADGAICVTTRLLHSSGQWIEETLCCRPTKNDAQGVGSVITYLRRYALAAMVGVAPEDDDGESGVGRGTPGQPLGTPVEPPAPRIPVDRPWTGPLNRTELKKALHEINRDVTDCDDEASLDSILKAANPVIKQALIDWPVAVLGDGGDIQGLKPRAEMMRTQFRTKSILPSEIFE